MAWLATILGALAAGIAFTGDSVQAADAPPASSGAHDFDFQVGEWRVHHRLRSPSGEWIEFEGTCANRPLMGGLGNVEDHVFMRPSGATKAVGLRAYDSKTAQWAIWWIDARNPLAALDPPVKGRFENGVGRFYSESIENGKSTLTRYVWSKISPTSAHWEQSFSTDDGKSWDTNWYMEFTRIS